MRSTTTLNIGIRIKEKLYTLKGMRQSYNTFIEFLCFMYSYIKTNYPKLLREIRDAFKKEVK